MSAKTSFKRIALGTVAALGFGLLSVVPANAAITSVLSMTNPVITVGLGSAATSTFKATTTLGENTNTITYTYAITTNPGDNLSAFGATSDAGAAADAKAKFISGTSTAVTGYTASTTGDNLLDTFTTAGGGAAISTASVRGTITAKPTAVGTYVITVTAASTGPTTSAATLTINVVAVYSAFTINKKSASGGVVKCAQSLTSNASTTITAGGGVCLSDALTPAGTGVWASGVSGYFGAIASNTEGAFQVATLSAASPAQADIAPTEFYTGTIAATTVASGIVADTITGMTVSAGAAGALNLTINGAINNIAAVGRILIGGASLSGTVTTARTGDSNMIIPFTAPVTAGTYTTSVQVSAGGTYGADVLTQAFTLTVTANADLSIALSTAFMGAVGAATVTHYTSATNAVARSGIKTSGTNIATVEIILRKTDGVADAQGHTITATVSGSGYVLADATLTGPAAQTARVSTYNTASANVRYVHIQSDGTAGTGSVTVSVTNVNTLVTTVLGTYKYSAYGAATALVVSKTNYTIGMAGGNTTGYSATGTRAAEETSPINGATTASAPAFIVKVTDAAGALVNLTSTTAGAIVPTIVSSDTGAISGGTCVLDAGTAIYGSGAGVGYYNCSFTTTPSSVSGGKSTLTIRTPNPAAPTTFLTTTLDVTIGGSASTGTTTLALDKTSYAPGEGMTVTVSAKDSAGNPVADGTTSPSVSFNKSVGGTTVGDAWFTAGTRNSNDALGRKTIFAPSVRGAFDASATSAASTALSFAATVADASGDATTAAAEEATAAANDATDAALSAAEAAEAATAIAQEAVDAVAELSASVTKLISALRAQITTLTNLVVKIQKKVKA